MTQEDRRIIKTAHARADGGVIRQVLDFGPDLGGEVEFKFMRAFGMPLADALAGIETSAGQGMAAQLRSFREFLSTIVIPAQKVELLGYIDNGSLDLFAMKDLFEALLEELTGRHPTVPAPSSDGVGTSGDGLTGGALPAPSTPQPSPPTV